MRVGNTRRVTSRREHNQRIDRDCVAAARDALRKGAASWPRTRGAVAIERGADVPLACGRAAMSRVRARTKMRGRSRAACA
jgi:hypothetical protein